MTSLNIEDTQVWIYLVHFDFGANIMDNAYGRVN